MEELLSERYSANGVRSRRCCIHIGLSNRAIACARVNLVLDLSVARDRHFIRILNINPFDRVFSYVEILFLLAFLDQQVLNLLIVDLNHAQLHFMLSRIGLVLLTCVYTSEDFLARAWNDALVVAVTDDGV